MLYYSIEKQKGAKMIHQNIQKLINDYQEILDRDPMDQSEDTQSILARFAQQLAAELGEIVVASPYMEGTRMYFDEKIARYEIKKSVGLAE
jgi:ATP phosphoribosyltransferase